MNRWNRRLSHARFYGVGLVLAQLFAAVACGDSGGHSGGEQSGAGGDDPGGKPSMNGGTRSDGGAVSAGGPSRAGAGGATSDGGATADGGVGGDSTQEGLAFPLRLTPIGDPRAATAHVSLYFTVTDANDEPVPDLQQRDFYAREDGESLDPYESAFRVSKPAGNLVIPTVLLLDLSRSVFTNYFEQVKHAAYRIIESLDPAQRLAIVTFSSTTTKRAEFTSDEDVLKAAIDGITQADGISTNLYGALQNGYAMWNDGFYPYEGGGADPQLVAGLQIVVTDGNDTAELSTLEQAVAARGNKRTIFIRVGGKVDADVAEAIGNHGVIEVESFDTLADSVGPMLERVASLNSAIYVAEYCTAARAGQHELLFTVQGNQQYIVQAPPPPTNRCAAAPVGPGCSDTATYHCGADTTGTWDYLCCPPTHPYRCGLEGGCFATADAAYQKCGSTCRTCAAPEADESQTGAKMAGPAIEVPFTASGFSDQQCEKLFAPEPKPTGSGGTGGGGTSSTGGTTTGGTASTGETATLVAACTVVRERVAEVCELEEPAFAAINELPVTLSGGCEFPDGAARCAREHAEVIKCFATSRWSAVDTECMSSSGPIPFLAIAECAEPTDVYKNCATPPAL